MARNIDEDLKTLGTVAKKGIGVVKRAALLGVAIMFGGGAAAGIGAHALAWGGLAIFGSVVGGLAVGAVVGVVVGLNYAASKAGPAVVAVGNVVEAASQEMDKQNSKTLAPGVTNSFNAAGPNVPAETPVVAAPAVAPVVPAAPAA